MADTTVEPSCTEILDCQNHSFASFASQIADNYNKSLKRELFLKVFFSSHTNFYLILRSFFKKAEWLARKS